MDPSYAREANKLGWQPGWVSFLAVNRQPSTVNASSLASRQDAFDLRFRFVAIDLLFLLALSGLLQLRSR